MSKIRALMVSLSLFLLSIGHTALPPEEPEGLKILQAKSAPAIDGDLADWADIPDFPVPFTPEGNALPPSADLTVRARFSFDSEYFYGALQVLDDRIEFPDMKRPEGDGFYLTFISPGPEPSKDDCVIFGFSLFGNEPLAIIDTRGEGGVTPARDVQLQLKLDSRRSTVDYELAIPWKRIPFFRPFLPGRLKLNLSYDDLDAGQKKVVQLVPDPEYAPESAVPKKGLSAEFVLGPPRILEFQSSLNANHFYADSALKLELAVHSPGSQSGWQARIFLTTPLGNVEFQEPLSFGQGMNILAFPVELERTATGTYDLSLGLIDDRGVLRYTDDKRFFLLDKQEFEAYEAKIEEIKKGEPFANDIIFRESLPTLEIRFQWIRDFMANAPAFADFGSLQQWNQDIKDLFRLVDEAKPALFFPGRVVRLGYRSEADGSLQPYSLFVPEWIDPKKPLPLLVTLSGGALDERRTIFALAAAYFGPRVKKRAGDFFILAPEVKDTSGWYAGGSGQRVIETIEHLAKIYNINTKSIILDGFGRGGYGVLQLALQNPGKFQGVIVRSGILAPPEHSGAENIIDMLDRAKNLNVLIVHGDQERAFPVDEVRRIVSRLREMKANIAYIEVKGAQSTRAERWEDVFSWLRDTWGDSVVNLSPPKRPRDRETEKRAEKG